MKFQSILNILDAFEAGCMNEYALAGALELYAMAVSDGVSLVWPF